MAHGRRLGRRAGTHIAPQLRLVLAVHHNHVQEAVTIQVGQHAAAPAPVAGHAGLLAHFAEVAIGLAQQQVVGVQDGEVRHAGDIALDDEQVAEAVVVDVGKLRVPGRAGVDVTTHIGAVRGDAALEGLVGIDRAGRACSGVGSLVGMLQLLELVVGHAGDEDCGVAVAVNVVAGYAHAPDLQAFPAIGLGELPGWLAGCDLPQLLLAVLVVLAVIGNAQRGLARAVPVGEQHGQGAVARCQQFGRGILFACGIRAQQQARRAGAPGEVRAAAVVVAAYGQRGHGLALLPGGGKGGVPVVAVGDVPLLVGAFELAGTQAAEDFDFTNTQHHQVHIAVAVDVDRIGAGGIGQLQAAALFLEFDGAAARALVAVELGLVDAACDIDLGQAIAIAVKHGHAAADHELVLAFKAALQAGGVGFFDEVGGGGGRSRRGRGRVGRAGAHAGALQHQGGCSQKGEWFAHRVLCSGGD